MDTRKLHEDLTIEIHNDGSPEQMTEVVVGEPGGETVAYVSPDHAAELVKRWNTYAERDEVLRAVLDGIENATSPQEAKQAAEMAAVQIRKVLAQ